MGHNRMGRLRKTKAWQLIVNQLGEFALGKSDVSSIAQSTLQQVQKRFENLENDPSVKSSFEFLLQIAHAFQQENPLRYLTENRILETEELSVLKISKAITNYKTKEVVSNEYQTFARQAAMDAVNNWYLQNIERGQSLFSDKIDSAAIFYKVSNANGFCELSRLFFSKFTERYLKYFLEREASTKITNIKDRKRFNNEIESHINDLSLHAFETSKITQSFAAGWFTKNVKEKFPEDGQIRGFLSLAFGKMKSELLQEEIN